MGVRKAGWPLRMGLGVLAFAAGLMQPATVSQGRERLAALAEAAVTTAPIGWRQFCAHNPAECARRPARVETIRLTGPVLARLARINAAVNAAVEPATDLEQYGVDEHWTYPVSGRGDCEDYVLEKKRRLVEAGLPASALLITVVRDRNGDGHAILTVRTDRGDYVLDNETDEIRLWHQTGYRFVKRQSAADPDRWVTIGPGRAPEAVATR